MRKTFIYITKKDGRQETQTFDLTNKRKASYEMCHNKLFD